MATTRTKDRCAACGGEVRPGSVFHQGCDARALGEMVRRHWGSTAEALKAFGYDADHPIVATRTVPTPKPPRRRHLRGAGALEWLARATTGMEGRDPVELVETGHRDLDWHRS